MNYPLQFNNRVLSKLSKNWGWLVTLGIVLIIVGIAAISVATLTTLISVVFLGIVITIGGVVILVDTFKSWWGHWGGFFLHFLMGILYVIVGLMMIKSPVLGSISITLLLGIFYVILGVSRLISSTSLRAPRWGWSLFNGVIALLLGILILSQWPASSLFIIGLFVGIDLIISGWVYMMVALGSKAYMSNYK